MDGKQFLEDEFLKELATICAPLLVLEIAACDPARPKGCRRHYWAKKREGYLLAMNWLGRGFLQRTFHC